MKEVTGLVSNTKFGLVPVALFAVILVFAPVRASFSQTAISVSGVGYLPISFGTIVLSSSQTSDIVLSPGGAISGSNVASASGAQAGRFRILGEAREPFTITLTVTSNGLVNSIDSSDTITLSALTHDEGENPTLGGAGRRWVRIGGTLTVPANALGGTYNGSFQITVNYN